jgi:hypothetical protein
MNQAYQRVLNEADAWGEAIVAANAWALAANCTVTAARKHVVDTSTAIDNAHFRNITEGITMRDIRNAINCRKIYWKTYRAWDRARAEAKEKARHLSLAVTQAWASSVSYNKVKQTYKDAMAAEAETEEEDQAYDEVRQMYEDAMAAEAKTEGIQDVTESWSDVAVAAEDLAKVISNVRKMVVSRAERMTGTGSEMEPVANSWAFAITADTSMNVLPTGIQMK